MVCPIFLVWLVVGAARLMEVAGMIPGRSTIAVSVNTRMHCSVCMSKIWDDTMSDQQRDKIRDLTNEYFVYVSFSPSSITHFPPTRSPPVAR